MSELKEHLFVPYSELQEGDELTDAITLAKSYYLKSEADKVIADLEESHKMEVGQLLIEIAELKDKLQNVSSLLKETREWLVESQKLHKRCADNAVKVIAELQAQKAQAEDDCAYWKNLAQKRNLTQPPNRAKDNKMNSLDMINAQQCKLSENLEPFPRGNHDEICSLANERRSVFYDIAKLNKAIEADPEAVSAHHKELWRKQAKAMQEYVDVLGERIKDLIDNG